MTIFGRLRARPWLAVLLGFAAMGAIVAALAVLAATWFGSSFLKQRRMVRELDESTLVDITHCGDRILVALDDCRLEHGTYPAQLSELNLSGGDVLADSARYGEWRIELDAARPDSVTLVFEFAAPWVRATNWHHMTSGLTPEGPGSWVATRLTPYSAFPDDLHHMQRAAPELESRYGSPHSPPDSPPLRSAPDG